MPCASSHSLSPFAPRSLPASAFALQRWQMTLLNWGMAMIFENYSGMNGGFLLSATSR